MFSLKRLFVMITNLSLSPSLSPSLSASPCLSLSSWHTVLHCSRLQSDACSVPETVPSSDRCWMVSDQTQWPWVTCDWLGLPGGRFQSGADCESQQLQLYSDGLQWKHWVQSDQYQRISSGAPLLGWKEGDTRVPYRTRRRNFESANKTFVTLMMTMIAQNITTVKRTKEK